MRARADLSEIELKRAAAAALTRARERTLALVAEVPPRELLRQHTPLMSPLVWDLAHIASYEEQWLLTALGAPAVAPHRHPTYDALRHPRSTRARLPLLDPDEALRYLAAVRARAMAHLQEVALRSSPLLLQAFVFGMVAQHEQQHVETMLATLQTMTSFALPPPRWNPVPRRPWTSARAREVLVPAGPFLQGTDAPWALDNERRVHQVDLAAFWLDTYPVTNGEYAEFVESGGYHERRFWTEDGWAHVRRERLERPLYWRRDGRRWVRRRFGAIEPLPLEEPVQHVCWYEADAYARWADKRLPTEAEWEKAASWTAEGKRLAPWGGPVEAPERANLGQVAHPAPVGAYPAGASTAGCEQLLGDVWEWTASDFLPYPGFIAFPYPEYSKPFFGPAYKVLRGGSWATDPVACRTTFRNWDFPVRRQIFAGFRCARDAT